MRPRKGISGFTLVEMIVVIAIILLLVAVLINTLDLFGGRSLRMARNSVAGYFDGLRGDAVNRNASILIAVLPNKGEDLVQYNIVVKQGEGKTEVPIGPGFVPFIIRNDVTGKSPQPWERLLYLDRNFLFENEFSPNPPVQIHPLLLERWKKTGLPPAIENISAQELKAVGIPPHAYVLVIRPDGRFVIPGDVPGYIVDAAGSRDAGGNSQQPNQLNGDLVLEDSDSIFFLDVNPLGRVRGHLIAYDLLPNGSIWQR